MSRKKTAEPALPKLGRPTSKTNVITIHHAPAELKVALVAEAQKVAEETGERVSLSEYVAAILASMTNAQRVSIAKKRVAAA